MLVSEVAQTLREAVRHGWLGYWREADVDGWDGWTVDLQCNSEKLGQKQGFLYDMIYDMMQPQLPLLLYWRKAPSNGHIRPSLDDKNDEWQ